MYPEVEVMNQMIIMVIIFFNYFRSQHTVFHSGHSSLHSWVQNWCFELWCWGRLLRVPWTARRSNQSILKEINPEYSLEGLMLKLKLKLQYFGHLIRRANSSEKTLMLTKIESRGEGDNRVRGGWVASSTQWTRVWASSGDGEGQGSLVCCSSWGHRFGHDCVTEQWQYIVIDT